jgi:DNA-directed RNA polymerase specialized sigma24 family protein
LEQAIRRLPLELRLPLTLYYFEEENAATIAKKLNISHSLVCQRLRAARNELHALLTQGDHHET